RAVGRKPGRRRDQRHGVGAAGASEQNRRARERTWQLFKKTAKPGNGIDRRRNVQRRRLMGGGGVGFHHAALRQIGEQNHGADRFDVLEQNRRARAAFHVRQRGIGARRVGGRVEQIRVAGILMGHAADRDRL